MQHQILLLFAARQASHPGKYIPNLNQRAVPQASACRERALSTQHVVPELVHRARRLIAAALAGRLLVAAWASTTPTPELHGLRIMPIAKDRFGIVVAESEKTMARVAASPQLE